MEIPVVLGGTERRMRDETVYVPASGFLRPFILGVGETPGPEIAAKSIGNTGY